MFKFNDFVSWKDVKISNILYAKTPPFFCQKNVRNFCTAYYTQKHHHFFCRKTVRNFCSAKVPYNFLAKYIAEADFVSSVRLNKSSTKDFVQPAMLWTTGPWTRKQCKVYANHQHLSLHRPRYKQYQSLASATNHGKDKKDIRRRLQLFVLWDSMLGNINTCSNIFLYHTSIFLHYQCKNILKAYIS